MIEYMQFWAAGWLVGILFLMGMGIVGFGITFLVELFAKEEE